MQVQRPSASRLPLDPWTSRPQPVPDRAGDQSKRIATDPVVRGNPSSQCSELLCPRAHHQVAVTIHYIRGTTFSVSELRRDLCSRECLLSEIWDMKQHLMGCGEVEDEMMDKVWATDGPIAVARLTDDAVARLAGHAGSREYPTVQIDDCDDDPQDQRCPYPYGSIDELYFLRGKPSPSRINDRTPDLFFVAHKASRGEELAARPVVMGVPIVPSVDSRDNAELNITYTVGEPA